MPGLLLLLRNTLYQTWIWILFLPLFTRANELIEFDKDYIGAVFEPYSKFNHDKSDYKMVDVENMLQIVSSKFKFISTYGMGTIGANSKWSDGYAAGKSAVAAANINRNLKRLALIVNVGAWQLGNEFMNREIYNSFDAAKVANEVYNGTVTGIIIASHYDNWIYINEQVNQYMNQSKQNNLKLGIRTFNCAGVLDKSRQNQSDPVVFNLIKSLNFIICYKLPTKYTKCAAAMCELNVTKEVIEISQAVLEWKKDFKNINENIETILETGWPSDGNIGGSDSFSVENQKEFWLQMSNWAIENEMRVDMFTAFDEPWKVELEQGIHEAHFGWWMRIKNDSSGPEAFVEKINSRPRPPVNYHFLEIGLSLAGIILFGALVAFTVFLYIKLRAIEHDALTKADIEQFEKGIFKDDGVDVSTEDALRLPYDRSYEMSKNKFHIDKANLLGSGTFGVVFKGKLDGIDDDVAFKMAQSNCSATSLKSLLSEIKILIHVGKHPNVVSILGAHTGEMRQGTIIIAIELCPAGCLEKRLRSYKTAFCNIALQDDSARYINAESQTERKRPADKMMTSLIKWSHEIARGMEHITSRNVIHADLATRNVLLTSDETAKITDFGLSCRLYEYTNYVKQNQEPMPWRWMAPESLKQMAFSSKSDVWSYGVTLWEIFSLGDVPFPGLSWNTEFANKLEKGLRMTIPNNAPPEIYNIMVECWKHLPEDRPDFTSLARSFQGLMCDLTRTNSSPYTILIDTAPPASYEKLRI